VCGKPPPSQACHITVRKLGGDGLENLMPLCAVEHRIQHQIGIRSFVRKYGLQDRIDITGIYPKRTDIE
jgi:hypothetical protein